MPKPAVGLGWNTLIREYLATVGQNLLTASTASPSIFSPYPVHNVPLLCASEMPACFWLSAIMSEAFLFPTNILSSQRGVQAGCILLRRGVLTEASSPSQLV
jgi:hypothetical protein